MHRPTFAAALATLAILTAGCSSDAGPSLSDPDTTPPPDTTEQTVTDEPSADEPLPDASSTTTVAATTSSIRRSPNDPDYPTIPPETTVTYPSLR